MPTFKDRLEARMLSGKEFTYSGLQDEFNRRDDDRVIDRTIQKLRKAGKITCERKFGKATWKVVS